MTLERIRRDGLEALRGKLGKAGMIRFLQQFESGEGDYASERHAWVDSATLDEIRRVSAERSQRRHKTPAKRTS